MKLPTFLFPEIDKANHYAYGCAVAMVAAITVMVFACALWAWALVRPGVPRWLPAEGAIAAALAAYLVGRWKEWRDARANAAAAAQGLPPPHGVEVADWQATTWGCVPVALPLLAVQLLVWLRGTPA